MRPQSSHCPQGHIYDGENTYLDKRGCRRCRACNRARNQKANMSAEDYAKRSAQAYRWRATEEGRAYHAKYMREWNAARSRQGKAARSRPGKADLAQQAWMHQESLRLAEYQHRVAHERGTA